MISNDRPRKDPLRRIIFLAIILVAGALRTRVAYAQVGGLGMYLKSDAPTELIADGKSQTTVMVDLSDCAWYPSASSKDLLQSVFEEDKEEELPVVTANGTLTESMSGSSTSMGTTFELSADFSAGTIKGTLKGSRTSTPRGWMNCYNPADPSTDLDRIDVNTTDSYETSFSGSIDKETGEFSIAITPTVNTSATKVSLFTHEECLDKNSMPYPGEGGWNGKGTISGQVSKDGGIDFSTSWTYSWFYAEIQVNGQWSGNGIVTPPKEEENVDGATSEIDPEVPSLISSPGEEENEDEATSEIDPEVSNLLSSLESFLKAAGLSNIDPVRLAAAGTGVSALIAIWMIVNHRAGVPMEKLEQTVGQWRWKEGGELPETSPEVEKKPSVKPPEKLPEAEKAKKESKPPSSLPEQKDPEEGVKATASATIDQPASEDTAAPSTAKKPSGEGLEEWLERKVDDAEGYRDAVDKTITDFKKRMEDVPKEFKESKFWKEKVAPKLKKLDDLGIESKSGKLKEYLRITKELLEVRKKVDADLSMLSEKDREGIVWLERGLQGGEEALKKIHNTLITDPAIAAAKSVLPKDQASAAEKILKQHQADIEKMLTGIKKLPRKFAENVAKAQHRDQNVGIIKNDTNQVFQHEGYKDRYPPNFGQGLDKARNAYKAVSNAAGNAKKWLGQYIWQLRDVPPAP